MSPMVYLSEVILAETSTVEEGPRAREGGKEGQRRKEPHRES